MISKKYNEILGKLEDKIENKRDFNLAKSALSDLAICYVDELTKITDNYTGKISSFENRLSDLEKKFIETTEIKEVSLSEKIFCPYCNFEFEVEYDTENTETICPKCKNLIELDWGEYDDM